MLAEVGAAWGLIPINQSIPAQSLQKNVTVKISGCLLYSIL